MMVTGTTNHIQKDTTAPRSPVTRPPRALPIYRASIVSAVILTPVSPW